ncbi:MAG: YIP1 family protein [Candidatus Aenigmatarchaeota archaeon]|nr:MAG: YIP1 family protein [Candidatus Aenigmarchaeota archaeon]
MGYVDNVKSVLIHPSEFFSKMPVTGGYAEPAKFAAINLAIGGLLSGIVSFLGLAAALSLFGLKGVGAGVDSIPISVVASIVGGLVGLFLGSGVIQVVMGFLGGKGTYEGTVRVFGSTSATQLLTWIPLVGILAGLYGIYLNVVGLAQVHGVSKLKAFAGLVIPIVVLIILATVFFAATFASVLGGLAATG